jgi:hypothetical protein
LKKIENLYNKLLINNDSPGGKVKIDEQVRSTLLKKILDDLKKLRKKQQKNDYTSEEYRKLDYEMRTLLLKEIQVILDEYVLAKENGDLKSWKEMYGDIGHYIKNFFYYRMDGKYESQKKTLKDYKFLVED